MTNTPAHDATQTHHYLMHFPEHPARTDDPHYVDFNHYHTEHRATARCYIGEHIGYGDCRDAQFNECPPPADGGEQPGLELERKSTRPNSSNPEIYALSLRDALPICTLLHRRTHRIRRLS